MSKRNRHIEARVAQRNAAIERNQTIHAAVREARKFADMEIKKATAAKNSLWGRFKSACQRLWTKVKEIVND